MGTHIDELIGKLEDMGYSLPKCDLLEWALGELPSYLPKAEKYFQLLHVPGGFVKGVQIKSWWFAGYDEYDVLYQAKANTPTTAALKLLITLKEEGIV